MVSNSLQDRAWIEVDTGALAANYRRIGERAGRDVAIIPMVKANGYGLGAELVARTFEAFEPHAFGVAAATEGKALRDAGIKRPIIVFTPLTRDALETAAQYRLTPALSDMGSLEFWQQIASGADFHVEIDTGMGRAGFDWREIASWGDDLRQVIAAGGRCTGVFTHFHGADAPDGVSAATQWQRFRDALAQFPASAEDLLVHASNSAASLRWPEYALDAVRPGIFLYGGHPAPGVAGAGEYRPEPVAAVRGRVVLVRAAPPGSTVGSRDSCRSWVGNMGNRVDWLRRWFAAGTW